MKRTALLWMASSAAILALAGCSNADRGRAPGSEPSADRGAAVGTGGAGANVNSDDEFVRDVAAKNLAEVELSRVALGRSASPEVKAFAQMMVDDHGAAANALKSLSDGYHAAVGRGGANPPAPGCRASTGSTLPDATAWTDPASGRRRRCRRDDPSRAG